MQSISQKLQPNQNKFLKNLAKYSTKNKIGSNRIEQVEKITKKK